MIERNGNGNLELGPAGTKMKEQSPVYVQLLLKLAGTIKRLGLQVEDKAGWVKLEHPDTHHKVYIRRSSATLPRIESTLPVGAPGTSRIEKKNGRIVSVLDPDPASLGRSLASMAGPEKPKQEEEPRRRRRRTSDLDQLLASRTKH